MEKFLNMTFRGLTRAYYLRHLFFGALIGAMFLFLRILGGLHILDLVWVVASTFLYPYARFVWEGVVGFILGENVFYLPALVMLGAKLFTMMLCWNFAIFIAPVGLAYIYWYQSRNAEPE